MTAKEARVGVQGWLLAIMAVLTVATPGVAGSQGATATGATPRETTPISSVPDSLIALVGGTVIDGTGGPPLPDATLVIAHGRITELGPRARTPIPAGAWRIDVRGKYLTPGFIDANVHISVMLGAPLIKVNPLDVARQFLQHGVTTVRDTWGLLQVEEADRDSLTRGQAIGARLLVAGNILGLGDTTQAHAILTQGMGRNLLGLPVDSVRTLTERYLDRGVDFIKIAVTDHDANAPQPLMFSPPTLAAMVQAAHQRGKVVDSHTETVEGLRAALTAGIDVLQHPEITDGEPIPADLARQLAAHHMMCVLFPLGDASGVNAANAKLLVKNGCTVAVATDASSAFLILTSVDWGGSTLAAIEALVENVGLTPAQALTAATRNGAMTTHAEREYGTLAVGKAGDVVILHHDPLADIHNIEHIAGVVHQGYIVDSKGRVLHPGDSL